MGKKATIIHVGQMLGLFNCCWGCRVVCLSPVSNKLAVWPYLNVIWIQSGTPWFGHKQCCC